jgi:hypothetical protein
MNVIMDVVMFNPAGCLLMTLIVVLTVIIVAFDLDRR